MTMKQDGLVIEKVQPLVGGLSGRYVKHTYTAKHYSYSDVLKELGIKRAA